FAVEVGGEERPDGPVDQAGGQDLLGGGAALALDEAAGELAGGVGLLAVVHRQREEVAPLVVLALDGGHQDDGVPQAADDRAVGLLGDLTGLETEGLLTELPFDSKYLHG